MIPLFPFERVYSSDTHFARSYMALFLPSSRKPHAAWFRKLCKNLRLCRFYFHTFCNMPSSAYPYSPPFLSSAISEFNSRIVEKNIVDFFGSQIEFSSEDLNLTGLEITLAIQFVVKCLFRYAKRLGKLLLSFCPLGADADCFRQPCRDKRLSLPAK